MSQQRPSDVLGALPRRRPQRRSAKRPAPPAVPNPTDGTEAPVPAKANARTKAPAKTKTTPRAPAKTTPRAPANTTPRAKTKPSAKAEPSARPTAKTAPAPARKAAPTPTRATARRQPQRLRQPAQPAGVPPTPREQRPDNASDRRILGTAAQAAAELAEIGLSVSARALRRIVDRLPRP